MCSIVRCGGPLRSNVERNAGIRRINLSVFLHRRWQRYDDLVFQAAISCSVAHDDRSRRVAEGGRPSDRTPSLCVRRASRLWILRLCFGTVPSGVRGRITGDAVVVRVARPRPFKPLADIHRRTQRGHLRISQATAEFHRQPIASEHVRLTLPEASQLGELIP